MQLHSWKLVSLGKLFELSSGKSLTLGLYGTTSRVIQVRGAIYGSAIIPN